MWWKNFWPDDFCNFSDATLVCVTSGRRILMNPVLFVVVLDQEQWLWRNTKNTHSNTHNHSAKLNSFQEFFYQSQKWSSKFAFVFLTVCLKTWNHSGILITTYFYVLYSTLWLYFVLNLFNWLQSTRRNFEGLRFTSLPIGWFLLENKSLSFEQAKLYLFYFTKSTHL